MQITNPAELSVHRLLNMGLAVCWITVATVASQVGQAIIYYRLYTIYRESDRLSAGSYLESAVSFGVYIALNLIFLGLLFGYLVKTKRSIRAQGLEVGLMSTLSRLRTVNIAQIVLLVLSLAGNVYQAARLFATLKYVQAYISKQVGP